MKYPVTTLSGLAAAVLALGFASASAWGHAFMIEKEVKAGSWHIVEIAIPHGCVGSPTTEVRMQMPEGLIQVRPEVKPGWTLSTVSTELEEPIRIADVVIGERVEEVKWSEGSLPDLHMERFAVMVLMPREPGRRMWFKTIQICEEGEHRWVEIPEGDKSWSDYKEPSPYLDLVE